MAYYLQLILSRSLLFKIECTWRLRNIRKSIQICPIFKCFSVLYLFSVKCSDGELFDPFFKKCRNVICGEDGMEFRNGRCLNTRLPPTLKPTKGQLISEGNLGVLKSTKNQRNFCKDFYPSL
jgi:hypothetical protein